MALVLMVLTRFLVVSQVEIHHQIGGAFLCTSSRNNDIVLSDVSTADYNDKIGFSIG